MADSTIKPPIPDTDTLPTDYYDLLGVDKSASEDELKKAYRALARELHPDATGGNAETEARFKEVTLAYETLRDPERRRRYDMFGPEGARGSGAGGGAGEPFGFAGNLGDIFDAFFGGGGGGFASQPRPGARRGADAEVVLDLSLEDAAFGGTKELSVTGLVACATCSGSGARQGTTPTTCPDCRGTGQVQRVRQSLLGQMVTATPCTRCQGAGETVASPCPDCRGQGRRSEERTLTINVPPGVDNGATLRVAGAGAAALRGGVAGDLYVHLRVAADPRFDRSGDDLIATVHIPFTQAALGTSLDVATLDGSSHIEIQPGTQSGKIIRLSGLGVPRLRARGRGDLLVHIVVDTPTKLSKEEEELLRHLAEIRGEVVAPPEHGLLSRLRSRIN
ncbi:MAG: molecular chaperone DnaJ [Actinomycetota bacterium]|nr:molecular chaperone DnaJ [Actinomycetota bacterium]